ncbi:MAG: hypothetical protein GX182_06910 [Firmicutes bacterium]|nr:hypothetical protein [Bacillota bacterium]
MSLIAFLVLAMGCGAYAATWQFSYGYYTGESLATSLWPPAQWHQEKRIHVLEPSVWLVGPKGTEVQIGLPWRGEVLRQTGWVQTESGLLPLVSNDTSGSVGPLRIGIWWGADRRVALQTKIQPHHPPELGLTFLASSIWDPLLFTFRGDMPLQGRELWSAALGVDFAVNRLAAFSGELQWTSGSNLAIKPGIFLSPGGPWDYRLQLELPLNSPDKGVFLHFTLFWHSPKAKEGRNIIASVE